jgi:hypothetical protein
MSQNTMSVGTFLDVAPKLPAHTSILLRGKHGIGKSQVVRQVGRKIAMALAAAGIIATADDMELIDRRLSQMSEGDVVGLPSTDGEVTRFNPPDWFKRACAKPCILFLDELNRATPEVMQAAFQIVLDRELNGWKLHPETRVFSAINNSAEYNVNEVDPALLDRFWAIDLLPDTKDWIRWARNTEKGFGGNIHALVIDFIAEADKWLDPAKNSEPNTKTTSRRSWERLNNALVHAGIMEEPTHPTFYPICIGYVGVEASIAFQSFAKNYNFQVTAKDILNNYPQVKAKIGKLGQERMNLCIDKVSDYVIKDVDKLTDKQGENLKAFMKDLDGELRISLWSKLTQQGIDKLELAKSIHKHCAELVLDVFGVPMGEAGIGVVPNIPGIFKAPAAKKR